MAKDKKWQNRIVKYGEEDPNQLLANPFNHRIHSRIQQGHLESILDEVGWVDDVKVNVTTGHIIDGHLRVTLALRNDQKVPVKYVEISEEEKLILATFDWITGEAGIDVEQLGDILEEIDFDLDILDDLANDYGIEFGDDLPEDPGAQIDKAKELREKWGVESGQLWKLGEHRIICGDCTDEAVVDRLMGREREGSYGLITDAPYNIAMRRSGQIEGDNQTDEEFDLFLDAWLRLFSGAKFAFICIGFREYPRLATKAKSYWKETNCIVWGKPSIGLGGKDGGYRFQHELIWLGGVTVRDKSLGDLWLFDRDNNTIHPTLKPIGIFEKIIKDTGAHVVYDPFLGSGTTLIACERLSRKCRGIEIEPKYIAVTLERWHEMTGQTPELLDG